MAAIGQLVFVILVGKYEFHVYCTFEYDDDLYNIQDDNTNAPPASDQEDISTCNVTAWQIVGSISLVLWFIVGILTFITARKLSAYEQEKTKTSVGIDLPKVTMQSSGATTVPMGNHESTVTKTIAIFPDGSKRTETTVTHPDGSFKTVTVSEEMEDVDL